MFVDTTKGERLKTAKDVYAKHGMVSSASRLASEAGVEVLKRGGNAVDAYVATALALNVVEFNASGLGGSGFATIRFAETGEVVCLDYRGGILGTEPTAKLIAAAHGQNDWPKVGGKSVSLMGELKGLMTAQKRYGKLTFKEAAEPAIRLAEEGFPIHKMQSMIIEDNMKALKEFNDVETLPLFRPDGTPLQEGDLLRQPKLAALFRSIGAEGEGFFYGGPVARAISSAVKRAGGVIEPEDLAGFELFVRKPITGTYRGYQIYSMAPASTGGTHIVEILNVMERFPLGSELKWGSPEALHIYAEACKLAFADRGAFMGNPAFVDMPIEGLTSKAYAEEQAKRIDPSRASKVVKPGDPWKFQPGGEASRGEKYVGHEHDSTSSFACVDAAGNIVASTNSINHFCGSCVYVPEYGLLLNNDNVTDVRSINSPARRSLSSMSPTIVLDPKGRPYMSIGAAGATRIIGSIAQIIMNCIDFGMTMSDAIQAPRINDQVAPDDAAEPLQTESHMDADTIERLRAFGHEIETDVHIGTAQGIKFDAVNGTIDGGADFRRLGVPVGY